MPKRRCAWPLCPQLIPAGTRYCPTHAAAHQHTRGTTTQRGYGSSHQRLRQQWQQAINQGLTPTCPRCGQPITPNQQWDLGHNDKRNGYNGPEHTHCNRSAGANNSNRMREHWTKH